MGTEPRSRTLAVRADAVRAHHHTVLVRLFGAGLLAFLLALWAASSVRAQVLTSQQMVDEATAVTDRASAVGPYALSLSGSGLAGLGDLSALTLNPAGLGYYRRSEMVGAFGFLQARNENTYRLGGAPFEVEEERPVPATLGVAYRFPTARGSLVLAAGYNALRTYGSAGRFSGTTSAGSITTSFLPFDEEYVYSAANGELTFPADIPTSDWAFIGFRGGATEFFPGDYEAGDYPFEPAALAGTSVEQRGTYVENGQLGEFGLGGAIEVAPGVMAGLSTNIVFGRRHRNMVYQEFDQGDNADYEVIRNGIVYRGLGSVTFETDYEAETEGINARAGLSFERVPGTRIGLSIETPTYLQVSERYAAIVETQFVEGGALRYGGRAGDVGTGVTEYEIITPWRMGAGVAVGLQGLTGGGPDLTVYADLTYIDWAQMDLRSSYDGLTRDVALDASSDFAGSYESVANVNMGVEYREGPFAVRGGYGHMPDPYDSVENRDEVVGGDRQLFSAGFGFDVNEQMAVEVGWMYQQYDGIVQPYPEDNEGVRQEVDLLRIGTDAQRNLFSVGLRYAF